MKAVILTIGDEILIGQIVDTNSSWIAEHLNLLGIEITEMVSISDSSAHIISTLRRYEGNVDVVICTGGLGPTSDDITKHTITAYFNTALVENTEVMNDIHTLFQKRGMQVTEVNRLQALVPKACKILRNPSGTAPGMWFERNGTLFVFLPRVPYELMDIFNTTLLNELANRLKGQVIAHQTVLTQGIPESYLSEMIKDWEKALPRNIKLAYLPRPGLVRLRLTGMGENRESLTRQLNDEVQKLKSLLPDDIYGYNDETLEKVIGDLLRQAGKTLSTAESCTGGNIARLITSVPGSSDYYSGSIIAYSDKVKTEILGIEPELIRQNGAVSAEVVEKMAKGAIRYFKTDYAIATSGIAGPGGGSREKPVGTTWIAVASADKCYSKKYSFGEHRGRNVEKASFTALNILRKFILGISNPSK